MKSNVLHSKADIMYSKCPVIKIIYINLLFSLIRFAMSIPLDFEFKSISKNKTSTSFWLIKFINLLAVLVEKTTLASKLF